MKRFYREVSVVPAEGGWQVALDGRGIKTQRGAAQVVPGKALAEALAGEWAAQGEELDSAGFPLRDLADYALDIAAPDPAAAVANALRFAESDTLCYRAEPEDPLHARQLAQWEPLLAACEARLGIAFVRASGIIHRPQPPETLAKLRSRLERESPFTQAALGTLASLAASLVIALAALEDGAEAEALFAAANLEEDAQAEQWGWEWTAEERRAQRLAAFTRAMAFARLAAQA